ncbi:MAG: nucleoside triphosphate pyrophosphohydrolase [Gammaproteobacteria bacterium]|nr:nucleoside triphosphate pyrophosphohydrolase [Gammaproteobacteria bacterium]
MSAPGAATTTEELSPLERLLALMSMLRHPEFGCPWDLEQTFESLIPHTVEEVHEVVHAIESGDRGELRDELGDLLFQVVFYAQLSREEGGFDFQDVAAGVTGKLLRRHPHVFPDGRLESFGARQELSAGEVLDNWEAIKRQERGKPGGKNLHGDGGAGRPSALDGLPRSLPALERARKLQQRAASVGFDWKQAPPVLDKLREEVGEFSEAMAAGDDAAMRGELGDMLFALVNLARHCRIDPESALRESNRRFATRFREVERLADERGWTLPGPELGELDELWRLAKVRTDEHQRENQDGGVN